MFDPYHAWLAIPRNQRPPTYYQLLGIATMETDRHVIEEAAIRRISQIRIYQTGPHERACVRLLNEIAEAETILLHPAKRQAYDAQLGQGVTAERTSPRPAVLWREPVLRCPALERRFALPAAAVAAGASPFEGLLEPGPIIEFRAPPCFVPSRSAVIAPADSVPTLDEGAMEDPGILFQFGEKGNRCHRPRKSRRHWPDLLVLVYLGFLILAGVLGAWFGG